MKIEDKEIGLEAATRFNKYIKQSEEVLGRKLDPAAILMFSVIYSSAFFEGYDYCKTKIEELTRLN